MLPGNLSNNSQSEHTDPPGLEYGQDDRTNRRRSVPPRLRPFIRLAEDNEELLSIKIYKFSRYTIKITEYTGKLITFDYILTYYDLIYR